MSCITKKKTSMWLFSISTTDHLLEGFYDNSCLFNFANQQIWHPFWKSDIIWYHVLPNIPIIPILWSTCWCKVRKIHNHLYWCVPVIYGLVNRWVWNNHWCVLLFETTLLLISFNIFSFWIYWILQYSVKYCPI